MVDLDHDLVGLLLPKMRYLGAKAVPATAPAASRDFHTSRSLVDALEKAGFTISEMAQLERASAIAKEAMKNKRKS